jgi:heme-degrading monooxygenase HmoA
VIVRVFHPGTEDDFERVVTETGIPTVKAQEGCSQVTVGQSRWSQQPEFVVVTHWESVEALRGFAGPDWQQAVIDPRKSPCSPASSALTTRRSPRAEPAALARQAPRARPGTTPMYCMR